MIPPLEDLDHFHVHVADLAAAEAWYSRVLGLHRDSRLEFWMNGGGPLMIRNAEGSVHLSLFERPRRDSRSTLAFRSSAAAFLQWRRHLESVLPGPVELEDHTVSWSLYFSDPDGNPFEITTYEHEAVRLGLDSGSP
jgi:catechol-2,3-dioxygenase